MKMDRLKLVTEACKQNRTQKQIEIETGLSRKTVCNAFSGRTDVSERTARAIAKALGVPVQDVVVL